MKVGGIMNYYYISYVYFIGKEGGVRVQALFGPA